MMLAVHRPSLGAHTSLFVYDKALVAASACEAIARARPDLADQLRRASCGIALNIAEGAAEYSAREKMRFYRMARRSTAESESALDLVDEVVPDGPSSAHARNVLAQVHSLLTRLMQGVGSRKD